MKRCGKCGQLKERDLFSNETRKPDGKQVWCKECSGQWRKDNRERLNARARERMKTDPDYQEERKLTHRAWGRKHAEHKREYEKRQRGKHPEGYKARRSRYALENPEKIKLLARTRQKVYYYLKKGKITKPDKCQWCGAIGGKLEAAHKDYNQPLEVVWLCRHCHRKWDYWEPKTKGVV